MQQRGTIKAIIAAAIVAVAAAVAIGYQHHYQSMRFTLMDLQAQNQADTVFRSDSLQLRLVHFFDRHAYTPSGLLHPARTANERLLAHYLLGRAYADMGDAPMAIHAYREAVDCADTTRASCDYAVLRSVYGQMAFIFNLQNLPDAQLYALKNCERCEWILGDTISAIATFARQMNAYYNKSDTDSILIIAKEMSRKYELYGHAIEATHFYGLPIAIHIDRKMFAEANRMLNLVQCNHDIFDSLNTPSRGRELYYYHIGQCCQARNQLDSAEFYFRKTLEYGYYEAGYRGLLSVFQSRNIGDSIYKYARLYADANDYDHDQMRTEAVERTAKLYDYNVQQRIANENEREAIKLRYGIIVLFIACTLIYVWNKRKQERRLEEIRKLKFELELAKFRRGKAETELERLMADTHNEAEERKRLVEEKRHEVAMYRKSEEYATEQIKKADVSDYIEMLLNDNSILRIKELSQPKKNIVRPSDAEWESMVVACRPKLYPVIDLIAQDRRLSQRDLRACLLVLLGFSNSDLMVLFNLDTRQAANEIKKKLNRHLFNDTSTRTLRGNLFRSIIQKTSVSP